MSMSDIEVVDVLLSIQEHWQENGVFNKFTVAEAIIFNEQIERQIGIVESKIARTA